MKKSNVTNFTEGPITGPLIKFALPMLFALFLQAMYGAVDLMVVGQFASAADVSGVSTGSQIMMMSVHIIAGLSMGLTILTARKIGQGRSEEAGEVIGTGIAYFMLLGLVLTFIMVLFAPQISSLMNAPIEAFAATTQYIRICAMGSIVIILYNLIGSVFRGLGDSRTPLFSVAVACVVNIAGDLLLVKGFNMGAAGAAYATVLAQTISVLVSWLFIRRQSLPFTMSRKDVRFNGMIVADITRIGFPLALQDLLVGASFAVLLAIVNSLGLTASAGVGVAEKVCGFIMLIPSSFMQALSAFVAQNMGAGKRKRALACLKSGLVISMIAGISMFFVTWYLGDVLSGLFAREPEIIQASWSYLRAYAIDCILTAVLFCMIGFFNGTGHTRFVMIQGIVGAFCVRIPVAFFMSHLEPVSLFKVGLATPCSTIVQNLLFLVLFLKVRSSFTEDTQGE